MTFNSGPMIAVDDQGRAVVCGYVISGHVDYGYRAAVVVPLTNEEVAGGCRQILWHDHLGYLLQECKNQLDLRSAL